MKMKAAKPGVLTWTTVALLALFGLADLTAHVTGYGYGETFSSLTWQLERAFPILRFVVALIGLYLTGHLVFKWPL